MALRQRRASDMPSPKVDTNGSDEVLKSKTWSPKRTGSPSDSHRILQERLRGVSGEDDDLFKIIAGAGGGLSPKDSILSPSMKTGGRARADSLTDKIIQSATLTHDRVEDWGYRNFPVITDHFNFLVYGVDLAIRSVKWFQFGLMAVWLGFRLIVYALMLLPALVRVMLTYYHDPRIKRRIRYGPAEREYLDIYIPVEAVKAQQGEGPKVPVVVAVMGGAFIIGHRGYNAQLGLRLCDFGVMTVGIDYRNFPRGLMPDMVEDVGRGVKWVFQNIELYGGDKDNMMLLGQSAGAHLSVMTLMEHCLLEATIEKPIQENVDVDAPKYETDWSVSNLKAYLGISGPYDLERLGPHLASRGLYPRIMDHMTAGDLRGCSPERLLDTPDWKAVQDVAVSKLPPIHLFHGYCDKAVPVWSSIDFAEKLKNAGAKVTLDLRRGMTHTYPVIEGPMKRHDPQVEIILPILFGNGAEKRIGESKLPPMWPICILDVAGHVSPF